MAPISNEAIWELKITSIGEYACADNCVVYAYAKDDFSGKQYQELSVYAFKEKKLQYEHFRVEDSHTQTQMYYRPETSLVKSANNSKVLEVASAPLFCVGDMIYKNDNTCIGKITAKKNIVDGNGHFVSTEITIETDDTGITLNIGDKIYTYLLNPGRFIGNKVIDDPLRQAVASFSLSSFAEKLDSSYDFSGNKDNMLTAPIGDENYGELNTIFSELSVASGKLINKDSKVVICVKTISGGSAGLTRRNCQGYIIVSESLSLSGFTHEILHSIGLNHIADDPKNVMWYEDIEGIQKTPISNTPCRVSSFYNILILKNGDVLNTAIGTQVFQRQWLNIIR
jgi:hypothetical protein